MVNPWSARCWAGRGAGERAPSTDLAARNVSGIVTEGYSCCEDRAFVGVCPAARGRKAGLNGVVTDIGDYVCAGLLGGHRRRGASDEPPPLRSEY